MAGFGTKDSLRKQNVAERLYDSKGKRVAVMRPGKTAEDKRIGAWASKHERNDKQAAYREACASTSKR